jgi:hypothetical protein
MDVKSPMPHSPLGSFAHRSARSGPPSYFARTRDKTARERGRGALRAIFHYADYIFPSRARRYVSIRRYGHVYLKVPFRISFPLFKQARNRAFISFNYLKSETRDHHKTGASSSSSPPSAPSPSPSPSCVHGTLQFYVRKFRPRRTQKHAYSKL